MASALLNVVLENDQKLFFRLTDPLARMGGKRRFLLRCVSHLGDGHLWVLGGFWALLTQGRAGLRAFETGMTGCLGALLLFKIVKNRVARRRPDTSLHVGSRLLVPLDQYSFPSGHSATSLAFALSMGAFFPLALVPLLCLSLLISLSRVALRVHYPLDLLAGWTLGAMTAGLGLSLFLR